MKQRLSLHMITQDQPRETKVQSIESKQMLHCFFSDLLHRVNVFVMSQISLREEILNALE